jgi:putative FmdB family regulatory protein
MPLYEYLCESCAHRFERIRKFSDPPLTDCPSCGGKVEKLISSPAIQFKGSGFYITDYAKAGKPGESSAKDSSKDSSSKSTAPAATDSSSEPKADKSDKTEKSSSPSSTSSTESSTAKPSATSDKT